MYQGFQSFSKNNGESRVLVRRQEMGPIDGSSTILDGKAFGQILHTVRSDRGLSRSDLASAMQRVDTSISVTQQWVVRVEAGLIPAVTADYIVAAAEVLEVPAVLANSFCHRSDQSACHWIHHSLRPRAELCRPGRQPLNHSGLASAMVCSRTLTLNPRPWGGSIRILGRSSLSTFDDTKVS